MICTFSQNEVVAHENIEFARILFFYYRRARNTPITFFSDRIHSIYTLVFGLHFASQCFAFFCTSHWTKRIEWIIVLFRWWGDGWCRVTFRILIFIWIIIISRTNTEIGYYYRHRQTPIAIAPKRTRTHTPTKNTRTSKEDKYQHKMMDYDWS